ncbi:Rho GTPase activator Rga, putative [Talaromyces stipitatus ATCC 10500]|uniref:Rho GTPase activator Rga, putative n=1 Tax=Talaromyces stipitatus (strain ATCC 10500 / CBS 375.48 / QM 6759 / NRRL 1006) TaxID=441959 RepID=B8M2F0_TALSN|nr:Rho GTPase activator Rga, putative [Talaromyces stipitatus ATCC 10500]EED21614.1 Rho GTPase activator Rga, putative [Talaromyces stipitatus ATCC 10500]
MESPAGFSDAAMDQDDIPYPCKGCGEILEEGKAFELAGNRWHIDCFRCNTCNTLLDSDAHLLLLGDGSLICSNCTYSCSSCGNKIEDLAILTGDQAFCANCFKCRNCKRRIENLRYARTSQGIFCMDCHESLMQRRRKKKTAAKKPSTIYDKSLPSLPPTMEDARANREPETLPAREYSASPDVPGRGYPVDERTSSRTRSEEPPAQQPEPTHNQVDNLILPSSAYRPDGNKRQSTMSTRSDVDAGEFLIPVAFDPTPEERVTPRSEPVPEETRHPRDYMDNSHPATSSRQASADRTETSQVSAPHIAFQAKERQPSDSTTDQNRWRQEPTPKVAQTKTDSSDGFKLQEAPRGRKSASTNSSKSDLHTAKEGTSVSTGSPGAATATSSESSKPPQSFTEKPTSPSVSISSPPVRSPGQNRNSYIEIETNRVDANRAFPKLNTLQFPPKRGDSLEHFVSSQIQRKDVGSTPRSPSGQVEKKTNVGAVTTEQGRDSKEPSGVSRQLTHMSDESEGSRNASAEPTNVPISLDNYHTRNGSHAPSLSDGVKNNLNSSPGLLRYSGGGDFSLDEDLARILGAEGQAGKRESFKRQMTNSVRHGRSYSDKGSVMSKDGKWPKSPVIGSPFAQDVSSPDTASPSEQREDMSWLRGELRRERQRVVERDQKIAELERALNAQADVRKANTELREKRSTMVVLDTKKEVVMRELAAITEHLDREKHGAAPLDLEKITNSVVRSFAEKLQQLKDSFAPQIEELMQNRNDIVEEVANLSRMKDKSFQEFEQLSSKNAQLAELNNQLVNQIQGLYKASSATESTRSTNGLGVYSHNKEKSTGSVDASKAADLASSVSTMTIQDEAEPATIVPGPQVVSIRKGQVRKFNWKRGGQSVAKGVSKGLKAFSGEKEIIGPDGTVQQVEGVNPPLPRSQTQEPRFGFFGNQKRQAAWKNQTNGSSPALVDAALTSESLFGVDLEQRLEQEKSIIPSIVTRCIQEVELRGMDEEGIYRKSGASTVTQIIREGFEHANDYDISDPDLDIHAVTSALKQYFRKLPTPLITHEIYDSVIETNEVSGQSARVEALRASLDGLPRVHRDVLEFLIFHLKRVVEHEKTNLMTSQNIAVVFAPTIMRPKDIAREMTDVQKKNEALKFIVENCQEIFM